MCRYLKYINQKISQIKYQQQKVQLNFKFFDYESDEQNLNQSISRISPQFQQFSYQLKQVASQLGVVGLSFPQINFPVQSFCLLKNNFQKFDKWFNYQNQPQDYDIFINPNIHQKSNLEIYDWEYNPSFYKNAFLIKRPIDIQVHYINEDLEMVEKNLVNFEARLYCHFLDYLKGFDEIKKIGKRDNFVQSIQDWKQINEKFEEFIQKFPNFMNNQENTYISFVQDEYKSLKKLQSSKNYYGQANDINEIMEIIN